MALFCSSCNIEYSSDSKFCRQCGSQLQEKKEEVQSSSDLLPTIEKKSSSPAKRSWMLVGIAIAGVILVALIGYLFSPVEQCVRDNVNAGKAQGLELRDSYPGEMEDTIRLMCEEIHG